MLKNCKDKFEAKHFNQKYCFKSECVKVWVETAKVKNWKKEKKKLKEELETVQSLMKKAQTYFNSFIRRRDQNKNCISCDTLLTGKFDAGHYFSSGTHKAVTFDERNVHGQCVACNQHKHGKLTKLSNRHRKTNRRRRTNKPTRRSTQNTQVHT